MPTTGRAAEIPALLYTLGVLLQQLSCHKITQSWPQSRPEVEQIPHEQQPETPSSWNPLPSAEFQLGSTLCVARAGSRGTDMLEAEFITLCRLRTLGKIPHG